MRHSCSSAISHFFAHCLCSFVDSCQGDGGGPLVFFTESKHWELIGIRSYGDDCATNHALVYTRITAFLPFIRTILNRTPLCRSQCPEDFDQEFAFTTQNSAEICLALHQTDPSHLCATSNVYSCHGTNCALITADLPDENKIHHVMYMWLNGDQCERVCS